jgi:hypothetical protein
MACQWAQLDARTSAIPVLNEILAPVIVTVHCHAMTQVTFMLQK